LIIDIGSECGFGISLLVKDGRTVIRKTGLLPEMKFINGRFGMLIAICIK